MTIPPLDTLPAAPRPPRTRRRDMPSAGAALVWLPSALLVLVLVAGTTVRIVTSGDISTTNVVLPLAAIPYLVVGGVLITRLPRNLVGWLLWLGGMAIAITVITQALADRGLSEAPGSVPGAVWFAWLNTWTGPLALFVVPIFLPLFYPTGRLASARWWLVAMAGIVFVAAWCVAAAFSPFKPGAYPLGVANPLALRGSVGDILEAVPSPPVGLLLLVLAVASLAVRYRRSAGIERAQLKWFAYVGTIAIVAIAVAGGGASATAPPLTTIDILAWLIAISSLGLLPVAIGIAVLRYRLYEIDRLVSRTVAYGLVTILLLAVFGGVILAFQALLAPFTTSSELQPPPGVLPNTSLPGAGSAETHPGLEAGRLA